MPTLIVPMATAQSAPTELGVAGHDGVVTVTRNCDGTETLSREIAFLYVQLNNGGAGPLEVSVSWTFDMDDGSTPTAPSSMLIPDAENHITATPKTGYSTGVVTATVTPPDGYTVAGSATVTMNIVRTIVAADCASTSVPPTTAPPSSPPATPIGAAPSYTG
jgi:hypothetical protein